MTDFDLFPLWDCRHSWKNIGPPVITWTSNNTNTTPPAEGNGYQKRRCLLCGGVENHHIFIGKTEELLPCPCCGGRARVIQDTSSDYQKHWSWTVECTNCELGLEGRKEKEHAIRDWNRRQNEVQ